MTSAHRNEAGEHAGLELVLERETQQRDQVRNQWQLAQAKRDKLQAQRQQFEDYRLDYQRRWHVDFRQHSPLEVHTHFRQFMGRVDEVMAQLNHQISVAEGTLERCRLALVEAERRVASLEKLLDLRRREVLERQRRRDQKQQDELAQRLAWSRQAQLVLAPHR